MEVVLGIDPGLASTGYGLVAFDRGELSHLAHGVIATDSAEQSSRRLGHIYDMLEMIIARYPLRGAAIERLFFARNISSALPVAQAYGVVLLALHRKSIPVCEYAPATVKMAVVGRGQSDKRQIQEMVRLLLNLSSIPRPVHAADALATAICHCNHLAGRSSMIAAGAET